MPTTHVGPALVDYQVDGSGPGLLLVHGTGGSAASNWEHLIPHFAQHHTVVRPDLAGSGATTDSGLRLQLDDLVDQAVGAAVDAGQERFDVVGFSLGAVVAAAIAARHPDRVRSLVLIAGWVSSADARTQLQFRLWQELHASDHRLFARHLVLTGFSPPFLAAMEWPELEGLAAEIAFTIPPGMGRQSELDLRIDLTPDLASIRARTLVIGCTRDQMVPVEHPRALHAAIPGSAYTEFDTGHLVIFEGADELAAAIDDFIGAGRELDRSA
jgi:3-oxoadipate enol-lactonase